MLDGEVTRLGTIHTIQAHLKSLFLTIERLNQIVTVAKKSLGTQSHNDMNLETLSIQTYLFHIERLMVQIREYAYHIQYRSNQSDPNNKDVVNLFGNVIRCTKMCQNSMLKLIELIESKGIRKLSNNSKFFAVVNGLELQASELSSEMRKFNESYFQKESMKELFNIESAFIESFLKSKVTDAGMLNYPNRYELEVLSKQKCDRLSDRLIQLSDPQHHLLASVLIEVLNDLKKCYVVSRKSVINSTLDAMGEDIESLINVLSQNAHLDNAIFHLNSFYSGLESLYFSTNSDSRCSRNLFDKSRIARRKLRKACSQCDIGIEFLKQISIRRAIYHRNH